MYTYGRCFAQFDLYNELYTAHYVSKSTDFVVLTKALYMPMHT